MSQYEYEVGLVDGGYFVSPVLPRIDEATGEMLVRRGNASPIAVFPSSLWLGMKKVEVCDTSMRPAHAAQEVPVEALGDPAEVREAVL